MCLPVTRQDAKEGRLKKATKVDTDEVEAQHPKGKRKQRETKKKQGSVKPLDGNRNWTGRQDEQIAIWLVGQYALDGIAVVTSEFDSPHL